MIYLVQRTIRNDCQWVRPSTGRVGDQGESEYVQDNGFGHEDWNFNLDLAIGGWVYGYAYYTPTESRWDGKFSFAFLERSGDRWYLAGFYVNAEYVPDGAPRSDAVLKRKLSDLSARFRGTGAARS